MAQEWYVDHKGKTVGPFESSQLKQLAKTGKIDRTTKIRRGDEGRWVDATKVQGLFPALEDKQSGSMISKPKSVSSPAPIVVRPQPIQQTQRQKECDYCGELIAVNAVKCRHCNEFLDGRSQSQGSYQQPQTAVPVIQQSINVSQVTNFTHGKRWSRGMAIVLSFLWPGLGQMYKGQVINGLVWMVLTIVGYFPLVIPGLILHLFCIIGAGRGDTSR
jgi:TM2 domain-containing membrane protein YozV